MGFVGASGDADCYVVDALACELFDRGLDSLAVELVNECGSGFDMTVHPERGDAMDAIVFGVELVVALNISGISKIPGGRAPVSVNLMYDRENGLMLDKSLSVGAMLACFGREQPWYSKAPFVKKELAHAGSHLYLYEKKSEVIA